MSEDIVMLPVDALRAHPYLNEDPMMDEASEDWLLLVDDIANNGVEHPLTVALVWHELEDAEVYLLGDGRHRLKAAMEVGLEAVPCKLVSEERLVEFMLRSESVRKNRTKSAIAWRAAAFCDDMIAASVRARTMVANEKHRDDSRKSLKDPFVDLASIARQIGVSEGTLKKARSLRYRMLEIADWPGGRGFGSVRETVQKMLYVDLVCLDKVGEYLKGVKGGARAAEELQKQDERWTARGSYVATGWDRTFRHLEYWEHFPQEQKRLVMDKVPELAKHLPKDVRSLMLAKLMELERTEG